MNPTGGSSNLRILVVRNAAGPAWAASLKPGSGGHEIEIARNGTEALLVAKNFRPHVVVIDLPLPGLNGLRVARQLREEDEKVLLIAAVGRSRLEDARLKAAGFDHLLEKPVDPGKLDALLASLNCEVCE
jgi:CheY-like chemotaxis protein